MSSNLYRICQNVVTSGSSNCRLMFVGCVGRWAGCGCGYLDGLGLGVGGWVGLRAWLDGLGVGGCVGLGCGRMGWASVCVDGLCLGVGRSTEFPGYFLFKPLQTGHRAPGTEHRAPGTGHRAPGTVQRAPGTGHRAPSTGHWALGTGHPVTEFPGYLLSIPYQYPRGPHHLIGE